MAAEFLKDALRDMYYDFVERRLEVILVPQSDPPNVGACIRAASSSNCDWYRALCADFESKTSKKFRKFKTKVKRKEIERILKRLIDGKECNSMYADWILKYAESLSEEYSEGFPF